MQKKTHYPPAPFIFMDLRSTVLTIEEERFLSHRLLAGIVLFSRNYESPQQLTQLLARIRAINPKLLFAIDQEGGRVQRFRAPLTSLPAMKKLGHVYLLDANEGKQLARHCGWLVGSELAALGIHINFAPVLDIDIVGHSVIADRAFGARADIVTALGGAYLEGIYDTQVLAVAKHFPGHGGVTADSHIEQSIDHRTGENFWESDLRPYRDLAQKLPAVMCSHVIYPAISPLPAGYCPLWIKGILQQQLHSQAFVFSDCLNMQAAHIAGSVEKRICLARESGCDYVLLCNYLESLWAVLEKVEEEIVSHPRLTTSLRSFSSPLTMPASPEESLQRWQQLQADTQYQAIRQDLEKI